MLPDPPNLIDPSSMVTMLGHCMEPIHVVWLPKLPPVAVGEAMVQSREVGELPALFSAFGDAWRSRWDRPS